MLKRITISSLIFLVLICGYVVLGDVPLYRAQRIIFKTVITAFQSITGMRAPDRHQLLFGFCFENPAALRDLRQTYHLDDVVTVSGATNDFESALALMHWVRDRYPHGELEKPVRAQSFSGSALLADPQIKHVFCGQVAQLLVQAVTALGGYARRVELRFTPGDQHAVVEVWSEFYSKWVVLDPDYDLYYTANSIPLNALELHRLWASGETKGVAVHPRVSPNNIYRAEFATLDAARLRQVYSTRNWRMWDRQILKDDPEYHQQARFAVKLLNYYSFLSYPLRNDWQSRPLPFWHAEANHVQGSLVMVLPSMPQYEDFLLQTNTPEAFYVSPLQK